MSATIDSLDIQISASMQSASASITLLNKKLNTLASSLSFISSKSLGNIANFAKTAENISKSLNSLDSGKLSGFASQIKESASAVSGFAQSAQKLNDTIKNLDFAKSINSVTQFDRAIKEQADSIVKSYGIRGKEAVDKITDSLKKLSQAGKNSKIDSSAVVEDLYKTVKDNTKIFDESKRAYADLIEYIRQTNASGQKVYLPFNPSEFVNDYSSMRSTLGKAFTSDSSARGAQDIDSYVRELNSVLGETIQVENNAAATFQNLVDAVRQGRDAFLSYGDAVKTGFLSDDDVWKNLVEAAKAVYGLNNEMQKASETASTSPLSKFAEGMTALNNIKTPSIQWVSTLSEGLEKLGRLDASGLSGIADSLKKFEGISATGLKTAATAIERLAGISNDKINSIVESLSKLSGSLTFDASNLLNLSTAVSRLGGKAATQAVTNIAPLSAQLQNLVRQLNNIGSLSFDTTTLSELISSISKLGGKFVTNAIENIPKLATALRNLMQVLSTAPTISRNIIDMTNALANLASQGSKVSVTSRTITAGLDRTSNSMNKASKSSRGLASAFGRFYASWFLVIRGIKGLWKSIESSFSYIETLNYFDAAFEQVASKADLSAFSEMGYASADEYYSSFAQRAEEVTSKMSGFTIGANGMLQSTGAVSLGLDADQLMNYQAMFGQMASSMGVASETSLKLSQALTEIGADLASVKNLEFADVWKDMASGLAGMSRTLDKYGVNIRNVNLQQKLNELGIEANVSALNQNDKALLRTIILLDNTKYAWADLADTINQPANQLRLIEANFQSLSRTIGSLFAPLVKQVLPYVNALVIALQRLAQWLGNLLGIDLTDISSAVGGADISDLLDQTDDLEDDLSGAKSAADKLNKSLRQFDELKVITTKDDDDSDSGAGISGGLLDAAFEDAFSEYQKVWDEAFANLENKAQELADKIEKAFQPIKNIIQDFAIGDFFQAGKDTSALVVSIFDFFADAIDRVDWYGIGRKIGDFFAGIDWMKVLSSAGKLIWTALKSVLKTWKGMFDAAPIETTILTAIATLKWTGLGSIIFKGIRKAILSKASDIAKIFTEGGFFSNIGLVVERMFEGLKLKDAMTMVFGNLGTTIAGVSSSIGGAILAATNFMDMLKNGFSWLNEILMVAGIGFAAVGAIILGIPAGIAAGVAAAIAAIATVTVVVKDNWEAISGFFSGLWEKIASVWNNATGWFSGNVIEPISSVFSGLGERIGQIFDGIWIIIQAIWVKASGWFSENVVQPLIKVFSPIIEITSVIFGKAWDGIKAVWSVAYGWFSETVITPVSNAFKAACDLIGGFFSDLWRGIKIGVATAMNAVITGIESAINWIVNGINGIIAGFNKVVSWAADVIGADWGGVDLIANVSLGKIDVSGYATGGFPDKYSLFMAGEYGTPEMLGTVGGRTAVAGGEEITGIRDAVYQASQQEIALLKEQNELLQAILKKEFGITEQQVGRAAQNFSIDYMRRTGNPAYAF